MIKELFMAKFTGYHGTSADTGQRIITNGYNLSDDNEWFGSGIYFFETTKPLFDGFSEAKAWAINVKKHTKWAILKTVIETDKYIDLVYCIKHRNLYDKFKKVAVEKHIESGNEIGSFNENIIFIFMAKLQIDLIRAMVDASREKRFFSYIVRRPQVQIC